MVDNRGRVRFTSDKHRFVVTDNGVKVYKRNYDLWMGDSEMAVSPQVAGKLVKQYQSELEICEKLLDEEFPVS